jgi:hypothetical protein
VLELSGADAVEASAARVVAAVEELTGENRREEAVTVAGGKN